MNIVQVEQYIDEHQLLEDGSKVIVGLIGADSVALLDILHSLKYKGVWWHLQLSIFGRKSLRNHWCFFVELCQNFNLKCRKGGLRYRGPMPRFIPSLGRNGGKRNCDIIGLNKWEQSTWLISYGHFHRDSVETILLNLAKGNRDKEDWRE